MRFEMIGRRSARNAVYLSVVASVFLVVPGCKDFGNPGQSSGSKAPEIVGEDAYGAPVRLSQFQGKVVLLDFWATWCGPCTGEIPHELDLYGQYAGRPFAILGVSRDGDRKDLVKFLDHTRLPWPNILDANGSIASQWGVQAIPVFILIDHQGVILNKWVGGGQIDKIRAAVDQAVRAAETKQTVAAK